VAVSIQARTSIPANCASPDFLKLDFDEGHDEDLRRGDESARDEQN
jgi:hypothetical protein